MMNNKKTEFEWPALEDLEWMGFPVKEADLDTLIEIKYDILEFNKDLSSGTVKQGTRTMTKRSYQDALIQDHLECVEQHRQRRLESLKNLSESEENN